MRIRSVLAAALFAAALTATGTATATAVADLPRQAAVGDDRHTCFGSIDTSSSHISWDGVHCRGF